MLYFNAPSQTTSQKGFTLIELLVVIAMIGILTAISAPSFLSLLNRNRVSNATIRLKSSLVEAQTNSVRVGKSCSLTINSGTGAANTLVDNVSATTPQCWRTGADSFADTNVSLRIVNSDNTSLATLPINFDFKGRVTTTSTTVGGSDTRAIVISKTDTGFERCVMISYPLGIVRTGTYETASPGTYESRTKNCTIDP